MTTEIYNLDYDEELLSHLPSEDAWLVLRSEGFDPDLIEDDFVREVYHWQDNHVRDHKVPATATVLSDEFDLDLQDPLTVIPDLLERMRERYMKNRGRKALEELGKQFQTDPLAVPPLLTKEGRRLQGLLSKRGEVFGVQDADRALQLYDAKILRGPGKSLGWDEIDSHVYGQHGLTFMVAPPKTYKSWAMVEATIANAKEGYHAWLSALELPGNEMDMRLRCRIANVPWWRYLRNCISQQELDLLTEASKYLGELGVYTVEKPKEGEREIDRLVGNARDNGADIVIIDQLQYVEIDGKSLGEWNDTGKYFGVINRARNLSDEGPIYIAHQFNRSTLGAEGMPDIKQAKGSSAIEEAATLALGMWANKDMRRSNIVEIGTLISRNYKHAAWNMQVELTKGTDFKIIGPVEDD